MGEISDYLPLSQRPRRDETGVTGDWSSALGDVLFSLAALLDTLDDGAWSGPASAPGSTIAEVVTDAVDRLGRRRFRRHTPMPTLDRVDAIELLRELSARDGRRAVRELALGVVSAYDVAAATRGSVSIDPVAAGAVALARVLSAPLPVREVMRSRRLRAIDADWHVGIGPEVPAAASAIVLFLYERGPLPA